MRFFYVSNRLDISHNLWWSFASGFTAPLAFGFYLDFTLLATGIFGLFIVIKKMTQENGSSPAQV